MYSRANFLAILLGLFVLISPVGAAPTMQEEALAEYKAGHYGAALQKFVQLEKQYPNSPMIHYYTGLCKQNIGQINDARSEYQWVSEHGDVQLKGLAATGLSNLGKYSTTVAGNGAVPSAPAAKAPAKAMASAAAAGKPKVKTILQFVASWDRGCTIFQPVFEETKGQFKDIQFVRIDAEDKPDIAKKYNVNSYPTIVYLDDKDKVMDTATSAYSSADVFADKIKQLNSQAK